MSCSRQVRSDSLTCHQYFSLDPLYPAAAELSFVLFGDMCSSHAGLTAGRAGSRRIHVGFKDPHTTNASHQFATGLRDRKLFEDHVGVSLATIVKRRTGIGAV